MPILCSGHWWWWSMWWLVDFIANYCFNDNMLWISTKYVSKTFVFNLKLFRITNFYFINWFIATKKLCFSLFPWSKSSLVHIMYCFNIPINQLKWIYWLDLYIKLQMITLYRYFNWMRLDRNHKSRNMDMLLNRERKSMWNKRRKLF